MKKPVAKKTSKKAAPATARSRPVTKKAAPKRAAPTKGKAAPTVKKKPVAAKKPVPVKKPAAAKKPVAQKAPAAKKSTPAKSAAPSKKQGVPQRAPASSKNPSVPVAKKLSPPPLPAPSAKKTAPKPTATPAAAAAKVAVPVPTLVPGAPLAMPNGFVPRKPGRGTPKYFVAPVQAPLPPPTSRFADRFAPPRPPTRQMKKEEHDTPRQAHKADPKLANAWKTKAGRDLSDEELLAMPESEYMNEKQLEFFRMKLQALKDDLLSNAGETTEHLREDTSIVPDPADRATIEEEHALELRTRDRERKLLKKISQSLGRIESGEYGFCDETGEPIGLGRLIARPTATLSLEAQQRRELKQKMFGD